MLNHQKKSTNLDSYKKCFCSSWFNLNLLKFKSIVKNEESPEMFLNICKALEINIQCYFATITVKVYDSISKEFKLKTNLIYPKILGICNSDRMISQACDSQLRGGLWSSPQGRQNRGSEGVKGQLPSQIMKIISE